MCGRFTLTNPKSLVASIGSTLGLDHDLVLPEGMDVARYNVAPSQNVLVMPNTDDRHLDAFRWGLVPFWADDVSIGYKMINARAETLLEKPAFRRPFSKRRCLIFADGFFEWRGKGKHKVPMFIRRADGQPLAFAGLWALWRRTDPALRSCAIVTTQPNAVVKPIHDRMPAILAPRTWQAWLDPEHIKDPAALAQLAALLAPYGDDALIASPVSRRVNSPTNDDAACLAPLEADDDLDGPDGLAARREESDSHGKTAGRASPAQTSLFDDV